jgi:Protein of unknown function (DUF3592)
MGFAAMGVETILPAIFIVVGLALVALYFVERRKALRSERWPTASATIVSSVILGRRSNKGSAMYEPSVTYRYEVGGQTFTGTRIGWGGTASSSSQTWADKVVGQFPQGAVLPVRYDPADPAESVLDPGARAGIFMIGLAGLAFTGFAALIWWLTRAG